MAYVVTLRNLAPPGRVDGLVWTQARIEEAADPDGTWAALETVTLSPVETDGADPEPRDLTTVLATLEAGWYRVVWVDAAAHEHAASAIHSPRDAEYEPTVADIGVLLRARTSLDDSAEEGASAEEAGTFTANTRPTGDQVEELIDKALATVSSRVGPAVPAVHRGAVRQLVALRTALLVELTYFPEQVREEHSAYPEYKALYDEDLAALLNALESEPSAGAGMYSLPIATLLTEPGLLAEADELIP